MIRKIKLNTIPFNNGEQDISELKQFNYFFGANGSGKTTISKVIAHPYMYRDCVLTWENGTDLECRVYNRDFVEENFNQSSKLRGVFTLGKTEAETLQKIKDSQEAIGACQNRIEQFIATLQGSDGTGGKKKELAQLEEKYSNRFWKAKEKYAEKLSGSRTGEGMRGVIGSKEAFKKKILEQVSNKSALLQLTELEAKASTVFSASPTYVQSLTSIQPQTILSYEQEPILRKRIIGKDDVDIAAMIKKLGNSDWIRQGLLYYNENDGICPFCQQKTEGSFSNSLSEYFDETFQQDNAKLDILIAYYTTESKRLQEQVQSIIDIHSEYINNEKLEIEKKLLDSINAANLQKLIQKKKETSQIVELDSLQSVLDSIVMLITNANAKIDKHNNIIKNLTSEKDILTAQIWRFVIEELKNDIADYKQNKLALTSAIANLEEQIHKKTEEHNQISAELRELEKQTTTIQTTKGEINKLLDAFGFKSFKLDVATDGKTYTLVRGNGDDAHKTLSEGERNFVAFLYFYYLLKGSQEETGLSNDKVVVFDDPVSSLDNDVLFIVSTLIRELIQDVRDKKGAVKQVFLLTHNIYFHKEVTFNKKRCGNLLKEETFWLVKKNCSNSTVECQTSNPIKTSYELLWSEVKSNNRNNATIQNTLRRILENYFKLLGNIPLDEIYKDFDGEDKLRCKSLCSWINDGSHSAFDENFYTPLDDGMIKEYLGVFKRIFEKTGHIAHYDMMMGISEKATIPTGEQAEEQNENAQNKQGGC